MRAASHHTMFPCPWQQYRGRIFTEQLFGDLSDVLSTNMLFFAMGKLYCCTTSIPTCFFSKHVYCVSNGELPLASFLQAASESDSIYFTGSLVIQESTSHLSSPLISSLSPLMNSGTNVDDHCGHT